jgi:N-acetylglutamate synthase-like GNAT family acetyltransferase
MTKSKYKMEFISKDDELPVWAQKQISKIEEVCFPSDELDLKSKVGRWSLWLVMSGKTIVAYAATEYVKNDDMVFLSRAAVLPSHRGNGLQRSLISARVEHSRALDVRGCYTYTHVQNYKSTNNLIEEGFRCYDKCRPWEELDDAEPFIYWRLMFK